MDMQTDGVTIPSVRIAARMSPPGWALMQRHLFDLLNDAAEEFVGRYTYPDGTLKWRSDWPGMDGSDDPYEGFMNLALLYALGGRDELYDWSRKIWDGITWQWTEYGQIHREFDAYYDWMHHGEGYLYFYFLGLAAPPTQKDVQRAVKFANFYNGNDPEAQNFNKDKLLIRSPLNGSRGPRFEVTEEDWSTHRGILDDYLAPYEDIPGVDFASKKCPWSDDRVYKDLIRLMNIRMNRGDVPLNLNATSMLTHTYMLTADESHLRWVLEYLSAWEERACDNGGIIPDNVGLSGIIGEYNDGKWWGGYYGWRWPHGFMTIIEPLVNASMNAVILSGDMNRLNLARQQLDTNWVLGKKENGKWVVPYKHFDGGWNDYRLANPIYPLYLWTVSMEDEDLQRILRIEDHLWNEVVVPCVSGRDHATGREMKHYIGNTLPWFRYIRGENPDYPEQILKANFQLISNQLDKMRSAAGDPRNWTTQFNVSDFSSIHIWQELCPVYFEGLLQLTCGAPMHISHGGLQHGRVRYFDAKRQRPGLPNDVAALVHKLDADSVTLTLVNLNMSEEREVIIQSGMFGEHCFTGVTVYSADGAPVETHPLSGKWFRVELGTGAGAVFELVMTRYSNKPSYETPWLRFNDMPCTIRGRQ